MRIGWRTVAAVLSLRFAQPLRESRTVGEAPRGAGVFDGADELRAPKGARTAGGVAFRAPLLPTPGRDSSDCPPTSPPVHQAKHTSRVRFLGAILRASDIPLVALAPDKELQ